MAKRINIGIYEVTAQNGKTFEIERLPDGSWHVFEMVNGKREYWNDYCTKRDAVASVDRWASDNH